MKTLMITAAAAAAVLAAAPGLAQAADMPSLPSMSSVVSTFEQPQFYGTLGYSDYEDHSNINAVTGRLGARFGKYVGIESEVSTGIDTGMTHVYGSNDHVYLHDEYAGYAVGYLPVAPKFDLFARVGLGAVDSKMEGPLNSINRNQTGIAYGAGGQYFFSGKNGIRVDYTRMDYGPTSGDTNTWAVAYVRKF